MEKDLFIAEVDYSITYYMNDDIINHHKIHLVEGIDLNDVTKKIEKFYKSKTDDYAIYYTIHDINISKIIR